MLKAKRSGSQITVSLVSLGCVLAMVLGIFHHAAAQDRIKIELNMGQERPRIAVPDFKTTGDPQTVPLITVFNQTLWYDLDNAGIFDMVAKSFYPSQMPGQPCSMNSRSA